MLRALEVADFVIVERASLEFGAGFSVLSGETGAGKSASWCAQAPSAPSCRGSSILTSKDFSPPGSRSGNWPAILVK